MIRATVYWRDSSSKDSRDHEWEDDHWYWAWEAWAIWVRTGKMTHGVLWLTHSKSNSDHVVLDRYSKEPLPWSPEHP